MYSPCKQDTNLSTVRSSKSDYDPIEASNRLTLRHRIAALSEALLVVEPAQRDQIALALIEIASFDVTQSESAHGDSHQIHHGQAASPLELIRRFPHRKRTRHAHDAMDGLARGWDLLSIEMKQLSAGLGRDRWISLTRDLSQDTDFNARLAAMTIAHDTADPGLGKVVCACLSDEHQFVRRAADKSLMRMTMVLVDHLPGELLGEDLAKIALQPRVQLTTDPRVYELEKCTLLAGIADAAWSFASHRCRSPLLAALLMMDRAVATPMERQISARMRRLLSERNHPSHAPLRTVLRRTPCPILREKALRWLPIAPISTAAMDRLSSADSIFEHQIVLTRGYLSMRPRRAAKLGSLRLELKDQAQGNAETKPQRFTDPRQEESGPLPRRDQYHQLDVGSRLGLIRMSSLFKMEESDQRSLLEESLADENPLVRLWAASMSSPIDLPDYMFDPSVAVACSSALKWSSVGMVPPRVYSPSWSRRLQHANMNLRSSHAEVRRVAQEESDRLTILRPDSPASRVLARRMLKADPSGFVRALRDYLSDKELRSDALMLIRLLGVEHRFELDLISIVQSEVADPNNFAITQARASAVSALGAIDSNSARYVISESMSDRDSRVRANATETMVLDSDRLFELKEDPENRVRAIAIRRLIQSTDPNRVSVAREAGYELLKMLRDQRAMHRLSGSWVAQRTLTGDARQIMGKVWKQLINEIESLASSDQDPRVRARTRSCVSRINSDTLVSARQQQRIEDDDRWIEISGATEL
jgi:HEAT repeat protein